MHAVKSNVTFPPCFTRTKQKWQKIFNLISSSLCRKASETLKTSHSIEMGKKALGLIIYDMEPKMEYKNFIYARPEMQKPPEILKFSELRDQGCPSSWVCLCILLGLTLNNFRVKHSNDAGMDQRRKEKFFFSYWVKLSFHQLNRGCFGSDKSIESFFDMIIIERLRKGPSRMRKTESRK